MKCAICLQESDAYAFAASKGLLSTGVAGAVCKTCCIIGLFELLGPDHPLADALMGLETEDDHPTIIVITPPQEMGNERTG